MRNILLLAVLAGCAGDDKPGNESPDVDKDGFTVADGDCDDTNATVNPDADEICDGIDNDCDTAIDDNDDSLDLSTATAFFADTDADTYGDPDAETLACEAPAGFVADNTDCDDAEAAVNPSGDEVCDDVDNDCDGAIDDDDDSLDLASAGTWYPDDDTDTYGDADAAIQACVQPADTVTDGSDCDDSEADINPGATEICNTVDDDCDGAVDDDDPDLDLSTASTFYADTDTDTFGDPDAPEVACLQPTGTVLDNTDCDDTDGSVYPGATEIPDDGADNDCDPTTPDVSGGGTFDPGDASVSISGASAFDGLGNMLVSADFNADGEPDLALGAAYPGKAFVHYGPITSSATVASADATLTGLSGSTISYMPLAASDVDSDGYDDLWVANTAASSFQGIVHLVHGPFSGSSTAAAAADATITVSSTAALGESLRLFDDVTGDSSPDLLVGAPMVSGTGTFSGEAYLFPADASGSLTPADATATLSGTSARAFLGGAATSGDVNGDGIEDIVIAEFYSTFGGDVFAFHGPVTSDRTTAAADVAITTSSSSDLFGNSLGSGFDHDGDGYDDILVGAGYDSTGGTNAGAAYIYNGAASAFTTTKGAANASILGSSNDYVGFEVASVEDYNNDGFGDAWVSTYVGATNGAASLFLGPVSGSLTTSDAFIHIDSAYQARHLGSAFAEVPDSDGDGRPEFWIGAPGQSSSTTSTVGKAFLFLSMDL